MIDFEIAVATASVTGTVVHKETNTGGDYGPVITPSPTNIQTDQNWQVDFNWTQQGALFNGWSANKWELEVVFEKMGPGEGPLSINKSVPYVMGNGQVYNNTVNVNAGHVTPGLYRIIARISLRDLANKFPVSGFFELGLVNFYDA